MQPSTLRFAEKSKKAFCSEKVQVEENSEFYIPLLYQNLQDPEKGRSLHMAVEVIDLCQSYLCSALLKLTNGQP